MWTTLLDAHPIRTANRPIVFSKSQKKVEVLSIEFNLVSMLNYRLIFEDGEPSIIIQSNVKSIVEKETVVKNWIGWEKDVVTHYKNEVSTNITCGHISFTLTRDEHQALIKKTQEVNQKNEQLARELQDRTIAEKINRRLQGNLNKIEKDDI
jgi:hypothetical protein